MGEAREIITKAKEGGAGLVKFQLYDAEEDKGKPHYRWVKDHELSFDDAKMLFDYGASIGMEVFFSVFGDEYVKWCESIGVKRYKIAFNMRKEEVLKAVQKTKKPVIISGFDKATACYDLGQVIKLYCIPIYPTALGYLQFPRDMFSKMNQGFSDHTIGLAVAKIAIARGAKIIEKHFCLERNPDFPDSDWSMTPDELNELVEWDNICKKASC